MNVTLTDIVEKTSQVPLSFTAGAGTGTKSLKDYIIRMNVNSFALRLDVIAKPGPAVFIPANTKATIKLSFNDMDFRHIKGFLGDRIANLPEQIIPITVFSASLNKSKVSFVQPIVTMSVEDYYGVPCEVTFSKLQAEKNGPGASLPLQIIPSSPFALNVPPQLGSSAITSLNISNATAIVNFSPTQLVYTGSVRINKGLTTGNNFLTDSTLRVTLNTEIPLYGQASGISLIDTMKLDFGDLKQSSVSTSSLKVKTVNEMPLDANIQLYLAGKDKVILDSIFTSNQTHLVKASTVTAGGELQKANSTDFQLSLSTETVNKLFSSSYLIVKAGMSTPKDSNGALLNVKFKSSYKLKLNVGLNAKLSITRK